MSIIGKLNFQELNNLNLCAKRLAKHCCKRQLNKQISNSTRHGKFGFLFDIDGVIVRGKRLLPSARAAFELLIDRHGHFQVPTLFVTNAGNSLRQQKAEQLSEWLKIKVDADQVVMSHSPLKMFRQFHDKQVLVTGQGPVVDIAKGLGFKNVITVDQIRHIFTNLDMVDHKRRKSAPCGFQDYFPRIEAVILFGEPVRWETHLQLVVDILLANGKPNEAPSEIPYPHLPVLACNMDLLWMAEACMPRFGHGCFLVCLEQLYQKLSGRELKYTALIGKPSEITYHHADHLLYQQAKQLGMENVDNIYCIGDNPETDIYGANLYNRYLQNRAFQLRSKRKKRVVAGNSSSLDVDSDDDELISSVVNTIEDEELESNYALNCHSILVCTGVYCSSRDYVTYDNKKPSNHNHRDFVLDPHLKQPNYVVQNVHEAVQLVFQKEQ
ncbi:Haloacid dehalogenase-like hydrolase domain-containing 5 [Mytilus coruscus]|uniref:Haloacid dehalogenase-like hydrolase domain-containing 5 n=1 Tax=Mytilus coruscus TaxID=42192 RepID=A0A6J8D4A6_MYTCO|nr:Haloacid dehalogenase-like hydrolase domain-containing 5 [Mytilus coruscus]